MGRAANLTQLIESENDIEVVRLGNDRYRIGYCSQ